MSRPNRSALYTCGIKKTSATVAFDVYRGLDFPGAADLGNMFQFTHDFEDYFCGIRDLAFSRRLNPALQTFAAWLSAKKDLSSPDSE